MNLLTLDQAQSESCLDNAFKKFGRHASTNDLLLPRHKLVVIKSVSASVTEYQSFTPSVYLQPGEAQIADISTNEVPRTRFVCAGKLIPSTSNFLCKVSVKT